MSKRRKCSACHITKGIKEFNPSEIAKPGYFVIQCKECVNTMAQSKRNTKRDLQQGFIYIITNPAWPNWCKIGLTINLQKRLNGYNTHAPLRDYVISFALPVKDTFTSTVPPSGIA